jgi:hypothetical protein
MDSSVDTLKQEFDADGITFIPVRIEDAYDPTKVTWDSERVIEAVRALGTPPDRITVDVTGGTVAMTLAMMRVAATLGTRCVYVSSKADKDGKRVAYSQRGHSFDPLIVVEST